MARSRKANRRSRRPLERLLPVVASIFFLVAGWRSWQSATRDDRLLASARSALAARDYVRAEDLCGRLLARKPRFAPALLVAGEAATKRRRLADAVGYYDQIPREAGDDAVVGLLASGDLLLHLGRPLESERRFREALELDPRLTIAHDRLVYLLSMEGRRFECSPHLDELLRQGNFSIETALLAGKDVSTVENAKELDRLRKTASNDPLPLIGLARIELNKQHYEQAIAYARQAIEADPRQIEARAILGRALADGPGGERLSQWLDELPPKADAHPEIWAVRGIWAQRQEQSRVAARCFWEALRRDPNHPAATYQLARLMDSFGRTEAAEALRRRAAGLTVLALTMDRLFHDRNNLELLFTAAQETEKLGRLWEARAWGRIALSVDPAMPWARQGLARLATRLDASTASTLASTDPGRQYDLSSYPLPSADGRSFASALSAAQAAETVPRFEDIAAQSGIRFNYFSGREGDEPGHRMFEFSGGGVAVLDFDGDGWPDVYLTQGCRWPPRAGQTEHRDQLYRNLGDGHFENVTDSSGLGDERFSQGATVGDFNNDGFPDLYVANIGVNRLYANRGDGTFHDVTVAAGISADAWTTSCLLADVNGDGLPDIYDVNYVQGPDVFEKLCYTPDGKPQGCKPGAFEPAPDRFYLNAGDGRFEEMTQSAGMLVGGGNGLGVLAADFEGSGKLGLFVANDQDANFYFVNRAARASDPPQFEERGLAAGLAFDADGKPQACMGVAAGDLNGDQRLDLFVTNYYQESNTLYLQDAAGLFTDATAIAGLREPSFYLLGFGVQSIDGELDGLPDLVLANGHVFDFSAPDLPYAMPPQYFRNLGAGRFAELPAQRLGAYFRKPYVGRSLARCDWNRDGREDFAVSSLDAPFALVSNQTPGAGRFLAVRLCGVRSSRDAIGATITLTTGGRSQRQWLTAGDGYQASNQRQLVFGLGPQASIEKLTIQWPSGESQEFSDVAADQELIFVEGSPRGTPSLPRP